MKLNISLIFKNVIFILVVLEIRGHPHRWLAQWCESDGSVLRSGGVGATPNRNVIPGMALRALHGQDHVSDHLRYHRGLQVSFIYFLALFGNGGEPFGYP